MCFIFFLDGINGNSNFGRKKKCPTKIQKTNIGRKVIVKDVIIARSISACVLVNLSLVDQSVTMVLVDTCMYTLKSY